MTTHFIALLMENSNKMHEMKRFCFAKLGKLFEVVTVSIYGNLTGKVKSERKTKKLCKIMSLYR